MKGIEGVNLGGTGAIVIIVTFAFDKSVVLIGHLSYKTPDSVVFIIGGKAVLNIFGKGNCSVTVISVTVSYRSIIADCGNSVKMVVG